MTDKQPLPAIAVWRDFGSVNILAGNKLTRVKDCDLPEALQEHIRYWTWHRPMTLLQEQDPTAWLRFVGDRAQPPPMMMTFAEHVEEDNAVPSAAHFLLWLLVPQEIREPLIGDLIEKFVEVIVPTFGVRKARFWFWKQTLASIWPLARRLGLRMLTFSWLFEWLRRHIG